MKAKAASIGIVLSALASTGANAAVISMNSITGDDPGLQNPYDTGITSDYPDITASGIGRNGVTGRSGDNRYNASGWSTGALDTDSYFTFTLDANDGYLMSLDYLSFTGDRSTTGPTAFALRSSVNNFGENISEWTSTSTDEAEITINLSSTDFQNLANPIEFRLYGYSAGSTGTFSVNDYTFNGTVTAVPEPGTLALVGVGSLLMLGNARRKRKKENAYPLS